MTQTTHQLTRKGILATVWPIILAQVATAMTGVVDTAAIGSHGSAAELAAVSIASVCFSFIYWGFGFLRMSTTGLTAQAVGRRDRPEINALLLRSLLIGGALGVLLFGLIWPLGEWMVFPFGATETVSNLATQYIATRIFGAPAALIGFGITGWLLGRGWARMLLAFQIVLNATNAILDSVLVAGFDLGPAGIGAGTAIAEWVSAGFGLFIVRRAFRQPISVFSPDRLMALFQANRDIMIRTLALLASFAWFTRAGSSLGTVTLAGNQILLQFIAVSAFVLDSFAFVAEKEAGQAYGARDRHRLYRAARLTSEFAALSALLFSLAFFAFGSPTIEHFVRDPAARAAAQEFLPYCALVPVVGAAAWQLDGLFLGTTQGAALRNAALVATALYIALDCVLRPLLSNHGVWIAFLTMYVLRAVGLAFYVPGLATWERANRPQDSSGHV